MRRLWLLFTVVLACSGCRQPSFYHQPVQRNLRPDARQTSQDGAVGWTRVAPPGTVARETYDENDGFVTGVPTRDGAMSFPLPLDRALLDRGRERYNIYCAPCHAVTGHGDGMIVQRGFPHPPSFHDRLLREANEAWFVHVMAQGYGRMSSYADRIEPNDRWAIAAYIKALQLSQDFPYASLDADEKSRVGP